MGKSEYDDYIVNQLRRRQWAEAYRFARELREGKHVVGEMGDGGDIVDVPIKPSVSGLELLTALHVMEEEASHHWIEDNRSWNDILS